MTMEIRIPNPGSNTEQVFRAEDAEHMVDVLAKAQSHATKKIRQQAKQIATLQDLLSETMTQMITNKLKRE
jgi:hypothetical protein